MSESAKKWRKSIRITALILAAVIVLSLIAGGIYHLISYIKWTKRPVDIYYYSNYSVDEETMAEKADTVVATFGENKLTNAQLQVFYWMQVYSFADANSSYLSQLGLNLTLPLHNQIQDEETGMTWQQYFLKQAVYAWHRYVAIVDVAKQENYQLPEAAQKELDGLDESVKEAAEEKGALSVDAMLQSEMGPGITLDDYKYYLNLHYISSCYYSDMNDKQQETITADDLEVWFAENASMLKTSYGVTKEMGNMVDIRHILILVEETGKDEDDKAISTEEDWENCKAEAQKILDEYLAGEKTEERFGELAKKYSEDGGSNTEGGLYSNITKNTSFVEPFLTWSLDESRKTGDTGLVKTTYGYHVMYYVTGEPAWQIYSRIGAADDKCAAMADEWMETAACDVDYTKLAMAEFVPMG